MTLIDKEYNPIKISALDFYDKKDIDKYKKATINRNGFINGFHHYLRESYKLKFEMPTDIVFAVTNNENTQFLEDVLLKAGKAGNVNFPRCIDATLLNHLNILAR